MDHRESETPPAPPPPRSPDASALAEARRRARPRLGELLAIVAGVAVGFAALREPIQQPDKWMYGLAVPCAVLGGASLAATGIILLRRRRLAREIAARPGGPGLASGASRIWSVGELVAFAAGASGWLLFPPLLVGFGNRAGVFCSYIYGTPLMALWMGFALLVGRGGHRNRNRNRDRLRPLSFNERLGWLLAILWACVGFYVLIRLYLDKDR